MILLSLISGIFLLLFVLSISLVFVCAENALFNINKLDEDILDLYERFLRGRCKDKCPPPCLYASCLCLLMTFLFIPMGSLPQFVETDGDIFAGMLLIVVAQSLYIRGMRKFSGAIYQSLDTKELYLLSRFNAALIVVGATMSWYALNRGIPGNIFSLNTFSAMPLWFVAGGWGKLGMIMFFLLIAVASPCRRVMNNRIVDNVPLPEIFDAVRSTIGPALIVSLFFPFKYGIEAGQIGLPMYALDFALFWCEVFVMEVFIQPFIQRIYIKAKGILPESLNLSLAIFFAASGAASFMLDLYM